MVDAIHPKIRRLRKIQTMYVTNLRSGLEYIVKEQNDLAKDYYKKIAQPVRV